MKHDHYVTSQRDEVGDDDDNYHDEVASHYAVLNHDNCDHFVASQTK